MDNSTFIDSIFPLRPLSIRDCSLPGEFGLILHGYIYIYIEGGFIDGIQMVFLPEIMITRSTIVTRSLSQVSQYENYEPKEHWENHRTKSIFSSFNDGDIPGIPIPVVKLFKLETYSRGPQKETAQAVSAGCKINDVSYMISRCPTFLSTFGDDYQIVVIYFYPFAFN